MAFSRMERSIPRGILPAAKSTNAPRLEWASPSPTEPHAVAVGGLHRAPGPIAFARSVGEDRALVREERADGRRISIRCVTAQAIRLADAPGDAAIRPSQLLDGTRERR